MDIPAQRPLSLLAGLTDRPVLIVGGTVRDLLLGIPDPKDIDLAMPSGSDAVARAFAAAVGGTFIVLDEERRITRVVAEEDGRTLQFDFADFEGPDLAADLARRDFTVNAMALDLRRFLPAGSLDGIIDPFGGIGDVRRKLIRVPAPKVLDDDPLRMLRAARFSAVLGFTIDDGTAAHIRSRADRIVEPSPERVRDELFQLLGVPGAEAHLGLLDSLGLLQRLVPELSPLKDFAPGKHHQYDILTHSIRTAGYADAALTALDDISPAHAAAVREHLDGMLEQFVTRMAALRFACLVHDIAKAETYSRGEDGAIRFHGHDTIGANTARDICRRFRLSNSTGSVVSRLVRNHMRPLNLSAPGGPSRRALYRYCRDVKDAVPESVLLSLADAQATREVMPEGFTDTRHTAGVLLGYYYGSFLRTEARPFVSGGDLIALGMRPGPRFREVLEDVREQQAAGALRDRDEALAYVRQREGKA